jgi:hypothetical protein
VLVQELSREGRVYGRPHNGTSRRDLVENFSLTSIWKHVHMLNIWLRKIIALASCLSRGSFLFQKKGTARWMRSDPGSLGKDFPAIFYKIATRCTESAMFAST